MRGSGDVAVEKNKQKLLPPRSLHSSEQTTQFCDWAKGSPSLDDREGEGHDRMQGWLGAGSLFLPRSHRHRTGPRQALGEGLERMTVREAVTAPTRALFPPPPNNV